MNTQERWYRDIRLETSQDHYPLLLSQVFHGLHACISQLSDDSGANTLGVGFPAWNSHSIGHLIRLVSVNPAQLEQIEYEPVIARLLDFCRIQISAIDNVPERQVFAEFIYQRNRQPEKMSAGFVKRQNRRREKRGLPQIADDYRINTPHDNRYVNLISTENGRRFSLFIKRTDNEGRKVIASYNRYGLADGGQEKLSTIPHFNTQWQPASS